MFHDVETIGERRCKSKILFDHDDCVTLRAQHGDHACKGLNDDRRQAFGNFVEQQEPGAGAQDASHREHLLFAARQARALAVAPLGQVRKHRIDFIQRHAGIGARDGRWQQQILFSRERRKDTALFRAITNAQMRDAMRRHADRLDPVDLDRTLPFSGQPHDGAQGSGAPGAVATQKRHDFTRRHAQVDVMQDVGFAVPGLQASDFERRRSGGIARHRNGGHQCAPSRAPSAVPM